MQVIQLKQRVVGERTPVQRGQAWLATGGILGALAASSCCILPVVLFSLGASGAWLGNLSALSPYQPIFIAITLGLLASGFWLAYRRPKVACEGPAACARPASGAIVKLALWGATLLVAAAIAFPMWRQPCLASEHASSSRAHGEWCRVGGRADGTAGGRGYDLRRRSYIVKNTLASAPGCGRGRRLVR